MRHSILNYVRIVFVLQIGRTRTNSLLTSKYPVRPIDIGTPNTWATGIIPYLISDQFANGTSKTNISLAIREIHESTCIRFQRLTGRTTDYVLFVQNTTGCFSSVGRKGGPQIVNVGYGCEEVGVILHELMHTLGFYHEHQRSDRDAYVTINEGNITQGESHNFIKYPNKVNGSIGYDFDSITHYRYDEFSVSPGNATIQPKPQNVSIHRLGQRVKLSEKDIQRINWLYGCTVTNQSTSHTNTCERAVPPVKYEPRQTSVGTTVTTKCPNSRFVRIGPSTRVCKVDGTWTGPPPYCVSIGSNIYYWDFESDSWKGKLKFESRNGRNWTLTSGLTETEGTGPYFDHTTEGSKGKYLYLETSDYASGYAQLFSPTIEIKKKACLLFYYHMLGRGMGSLTAYVQYLDKGSTRQQIFLATGDQGYDWLQAYVEITPMPGSDYKITAPFKIILKAVKGSSPSSDIAIDDIFIGPCDILDKYQSLTKSATKPH